MTKLILTTSWDDGAILDLRLGEMLAKYGLMGTFYIPNIVSKFTPLQKADILELALSHEIGAHTVSHPHLTQIPEAEAQNEIADSKSYLEGILGKKIKMFGYPYGEYNDAVKKIIKNCGLIGARTVKPFQTSDTFDPYEFGISIFASNGGLQEMVKKSLEPDWEVKAKKSFNDALENGGIWHIWGHSWQIEEAGDWEKLERVFK